MALDVLSVLLATISILQNVKNSTDRRQQVAELKKAAKEISLLHQFLSEAKEYHDEYEKALNIAITTFAIEITPDSLTQAQLQDATRRFIDAETSLIKSRSVAHNKWNDNFEKIPTPIVENMQKLTRSFPEFARSVDNYSSALDALVAHHQDSSYGRKFRNAVLQLQDQARRVVSNADTIILNTVPLIIFSHYILTEALDTL